MIWMDKVWNSTNYIIWMNEIGDTLPWGFNRFQFDDLWTNNIHGDSKNIQRRLFETIHALKYEIVQGLFEQRFHFLILCLYKSLIRFLEFWIKQKFEIHSISLDSKI